MSRRDDQHQLVATDGWLIVDAEAAPRWSEPAAQEPNNLNSFQPCPTVEQVAPIVAAHRSRGVALPGTRWRH